MKLLNVLYIVALGFCAPADASKKAPPEYLAPSIAELSLSAKEVKILTDSALLGDAEAALRLNSFFAMVRVDKDKALYWAIIAAENGSAVGECNAGLLLMESREPEARLRAKFWLLRAHNHGNPRAAELLKRLESGEIILR